MKEYIERAAALDICQKEYEERLRMADYCGDTVVWNIGGAIKSLPAADVAEVRHGKIIETIKDGKMNRVFSCCGHDFTELTCWYLPKYCPNCGARMDKEDEHEQ